MEGMRKEKATAKEDKEGEKGEEEEKEKEKEECPRSNCVISMKRRTRFHSTVRRILWRLRRLFARQTGEWEGVRDYPSKLLSN